MYLAALIPLYGLAFDKAVLSHRTWNVVFVGVAIISGLIVLFSGMSLYNNAHVDSEIYWGMFYSNVLMITEYGVASYVLYVYSRKSDLIWSGQ